MAEADILNEPGDWTLGPDYGWQVSRPDNLAKFDARSGARYSRRLSARGYAYQLGWVNRPLATREALEQWQNQYEKDFFTFYDGERDRYFSGNFDAPLAFSPAGNEKWNISGLFVEIPGLPMYAYPDDWGRYAIFIEERDGLGRDNFKLTGAWQYQANPLAHGGGEYIAGVVGGQDAPLAELLYFGYGFRYWARQGDDRGMVAVSLDDVILANVSAYAAGDQKAAALYTKEDVPLGEHRVTLRSLGAPVGDFPPGAIWCAADAIEVMR